MLKITTCRFNLFILIVLLVVLFSSCSSYKKISFDYLDSYEIPSNLEFQGTKIGGLSGIDYDRGNNTYYLVSDDRSEKSPARFYVADINISMAEIDAVTFLKPVLSLDSKAELLEKEASDYESIRYNPIQDVLFLADEGGKKGKAGIKIMNTAGSYISDFKLDASYLQKTRSNNSFENMSFSNDYKSLFYATEAPLEDDGSIATVDNGGLIRIKESDLEGVVQKEFLYELEKVPYAATAEPPWKGTGSDNGLSEILSLGEGQFLTLERSGAYQKDGSFKFTCKVFWVKAKSEKSGNSVKIFETTKEEVVDFSKLPDGMFNLEGMTLGPIIGNKQSVVFVSDNNFEEKVPTMIYIFTMTYK